MFNYLKHIKKNHKMFDERNYRVLKIEKCLKFNLKKTTKYYVCMWNKTNY